MSLKFLATCAVAGGLLCAVPAVAAEDDPFETPQTVRSEIIEAFEAIGAYTAQESRQAVAAAREGMMKLDAEVDRRAEALQENWSEMSEDARSAARAEMKQLRQAQSTLSERIGALGAAAPEIWDDVKQGFVQGYEDLAAALSG